MIRICSINYRPKW